MRIFWVLSPSELFVLGFRCDQWIRKIFIRTTIVSRFSIIFGIIRTVKAHMEPVKPVLWSTIILRYLYLFRMLFELHEEELDNKARY